MTKSQEIIPTEYEEACTFVDWLELQKRQGKILDYCHIANESYGGTKADMLRGAKLKRMGRKRGVFDYEIFVTHGAGSSAGPNVDSLEFCTQDVVPWGRELRVELKKRKGGKVSDEQNHWAKVYDLCGIPAKICHGADEAIKFVERFIK